MIQFRYIPDTEVILLLIQILVQIRSRYALNTDAILSLILIFPNSEALQTQMLFYYKVQIQLGDAPYTNAIPLLIQRFLLEIVQLRPRHGDFLILIPEFLSDALSRNPTPVPLQLQNFWKQFTDSSQQRMSIYRLIQALLRLLKTVYGFFPTTDANLPTCSDSSQFLKIVYGHVPTTDTALLLIQPQIVYRFSRHGRQSVACSDPNSEMSQKHGDPSDTCPLTIDIQFNMSRWHL